MKKAMYVALVAVFALVGMVTVASATTNGEFKASMVIYPKIVSTADIDTVVTIVNDSNATSVYVHCEWMDEYQDAKDFEFLLTAGEVAWFLASSGVGSVSGVDPFNYTIGSLTCFAVDQQDDLSIPFNNLVGTATIYDYALGEGVGYNAYGFRKIGPKSATPHLLLNNVDFEACPVYLIGTYMVTGASFEDLGRVVTAMTTDVTLYSCEQDMTQDASPTYTKARFTIFDENEGKSTNTTVCFKCWLETTLDVVDPTLNPIPKAAKASKYSAGAGVFNNFARWMFNPANGFTFGYFRVQGVGSTAAACGFPALTPPIVVQATPLIGTIFRTVSFAAPVPPGVPVVYDYALTGEIFQSTFTSDPTGFISYDQSGGPDVPSPQR